MTGSRRRALLISGGINQSLNYQRYRNDIEKWCECLIGRGFHCAVCYADGSRFPLTGIRVGPATRTRIMAELARFEKLEATDIALVLVTNYGDETGFFLWGADRFTPKDLASALAPCRAVKVLIMGQCNGGVFSTPDFDRTVLITASGATEDSWACAEPPGPKCYDEFLYQFALALFGNSGGTIEATPGFRPTLLAAFEQARIRDRRPETPSITDNASLADVLTL